MTRDLIGVALGLALGFLLGTRVERWSMTATVRLMLSQEAPRYTEHELAYLNGWGSAMRLVLRRLAGI